MTIALRRQRIFMLLSGVFLGSLAMLNVLGVSRFLDASFTVFGIEIPFKLAVGVLPYPITFLCTDLICELYGRKRATELVIVGFVVNIWIFVFLWIGGLLPAVGVNLDPTTGEIIPDAAGRLPLFYEIQTLALSAIVASMIAYLTAQYCDVRLFHFWKWITKGRHLWLRNNGSTLISQMVDSVAVILITHYVANSLPIDPQQPLRDQLIEYILSGYVFKLLVALFDTLPIYGLVHVLRRYLSLRPGEEVDPSDFGRERRVIQTPDLVRR